MELLLAHRALPLLCALASVAAPSAQDALALGAPQALPQPERPTLPRRIPIHTAPVGGNEQGYGAWAAGPGYKVSFHDGFVFYPHVAPEQSEHQPLRWRTETIVVGGQALLAAGAEPVHAHTAWRYEYRWANVTEAYDVRDDGVEQTFVIHARPAPMGDLVVCGRVETALRAAVGIASAHAELSFADPRGTPLVRYGAAFAVDALGRREPLPTIYDGERITLTVPQAWLARATFPVTVDPLTSPVYLNQANLQSLTIDRESESSSRNVMVTYTIRNTVTDHDVFALLYSDTFNDGVLVFADFSASWNTFCQDAAYVGGADRWVVAYTTSTGSVPPRGRLYFHARGDFGLNTGTQATLLGSSAAESHSTLVLGGSESGTQALLAYQRASSTTSGMSAAFGAVIDAGSGSIGARTRISPLGHSIDGGGRVDVSRDNSAADAGWLVTYSALTGTFPYWVRSLFATRVTPTTLGQVVPVRLGSGALAQVDGRDGRFLVASHVGPLPLAWQVVVQRIDWPANASAPTIGAERVIVGTNALIQGLAYDHTSKSHWAAAFAQQGTPNTMQVVRMGYSGAVTETAVLGTPTAPVNAYGGRESVAYNPAAREFQLGFLAQANGGSLVQVQRLSYPAEATNVAYGRGCNDSGLRFAASRPFAGSEFFTVTLSGGSALNPVLPNGTPVLLMFSLGAAATPIGGCTQLISMSPREYLVGIPATMFLGRASVPYPLPDAPLLQRDLFGQWSWNGPRGMFGMSHGLRMQVR